MSNPFEDDDESDSDLIEGAVFVQKTDSPKSNTEEEEESDWLKESNFNKESVEVDKATDTLLLTSLNNNGSSYVEEEEEEAECKREISHNVKVSDEVQRLNNNDNDNNNDDNSDNLEKVEEDVDEANQSNSWQSVLSESTLPETSPPIPPTKAKVEEEVEEVKSSSKPRSLNPFGDDETDELSPSSNPFDDDDDDDNDNDNDVINSNTNNVESKVGCDIKSKHVLQSLVSLGFSQAMAEKKLKILKGDAVECKRLLSELAINTAKGIIKGDSTLIWQSPMTVSINSFLVVDEHTEYTSHITFFGVKNARWSTSNRYTDYATLNSKLKPYIQAILPGGIASPFPARRLSIFRASEEVIKARLAEINNWMNEVIKNVALMLNDDCRKIIYEFYKVDDKLAHIAMNRRQSWAHKRNLKDSKSPLAST